MERTRKRTRRAITAVVVAVAGVAGAGVAWAQIPSSGGVISACANKSSGTLRVVDPEAGEQCNKSEQLLQWTQGGGAPLADGSVKGGPGGVILDDSVDQNDIKNGSVGTDELGPEAVTNDKIQSVDGAKVTGAVATATSAGSAGNATNAGGLTCTGCLTATHLASGSVGTDELAPNTATGESSDNTPWAGGGTYTPLVSALLTVPSGSNHRVLVSGQVAFFCGGCSSTVGTVQVRVVMDGNTQLGSAYVASIGGPMTNIVVPISTAAVVGSGDHTFTLQAIPLVFGGTVIPAARALTAADIGRA